MSVQICHALQSRGGALFILLNILFDSSRKKRAAGSPDSAHSEHGAGEAALPAARPKSAKGHSNQSPVVNDSATPGESSLGRGRRARKEKEQSMDLDST